MVERYVGVGRWRYAFIVLGLILLPVVILITTAFFGMTLLTFTAWFNVGGTWVVIASVVALVFTVGLAWLCMQMRRSRTHVPRSQRVVLGFGYFTGAVLVTSLLQPAEPALASANWMLAGFVALYGFWLALDAWHDRSSV
jgi:hypothetical protein